jgi:hypothetical protein
MGQSYKLTVLLGNKTSQVSKKAEMIQTQCKIKSNQILETKNKLPGHGGSHL